MSASSSEAFSLPLRNNRRALSSAQAPPELLPTPHELREQFYLSPFAQSQIAHARRQIAARMSSQLVAPLAIVGPCSIHCEEAAMEFATRLSALQKELGESVLLVMRVYFEKPRTTVGWKGFLYDPDMDGSDDMSQGLSRARALLVRIAELGVPMASEVLDPLITPFIEDCLSYVAVGARTSESQVHRQMASGLSCAVGFKNATNGSVKIAAQACASSASAHAHMGVDSQGRAAVIRSQGNEHSHVILRGGDSGPNFEEHQVRQAADIMKAQGLHPRLVVDCSHGNSQKTYTLQPKVLREVLRQLKSRGSPILGVMLESHLSAGRQEIQAGQKPEDLYFGVSVTDACLDFNTTADLLREMAANRGVPEL